MSIADTNHSDLIWRKRKRLNSDDIVDVSLISKHTRRNENGPFYITLAKESPPRCTDSDDSTYDSFHGRETDVCRDTSDSDSYSTDGIATMEVLEYEVNSTSSDSEDLYSHDSSSGTDDFVVAAVASAIFDTSTSEPDRVELLADTEESDCPTDPELGRADYWTCVKCKNRQNNPMYRYCERCYQIRKTHFPPRPKLRKTRSRNMKQSPTSRGVLASSCSSSDEKMESFKNDSIARLSDAGNNGKLTNNNKLDLAHRLSKNSTANSAGESSSASDSNDETVTADTHQSKIGSPTTISSATRPKLTINTDGTTTIDTMRKFKIQNKILTNVLDKNELTTHKYQPPNQLTIATPLIQKDSGFSSCGSSQELSPADTLPPSSIMLSSQETFCSEFEDEKRRDTDLFEDDTAGSSLSKANSFDLCSTAPISSQVSNLTELSTSTMQSVDIRIGSSFSEKVSNDFDITLREFNLAQAKRSLSDSESIGGSNSGLLPTPYKKGTIDMGGSSDNAYGSCMMCLIKPKNGVFVHSRFLHLCCCYQCAVKVWNKRKRCPICNCKVKNVMKLFVH